MSSGSAPSARAESPLLSVVVPCHNEEAILDELYTRVTAAARPQFGEHFEIVLIDDGSRDRTWELIGALGTRDHRVKGLRLSRNFGHQSALTAGLQHARGDIILILDADLQDPPELLGPMYDRLVSGFDVVYGQRAQRAGETWFKRATAKGFYRLMSTLSDIEIPRDTGDFRLMRRRVLDAYLAMPEYHRFVRGMIAWTGFRQVAFVYDRASRKTGTTGYPFLRMLRLAIDALTGFSTAPLRICGLLGLASTVVSLGLFIYVLMSYFAWSTVRGWASLAAIVTFFGSVQLISLSVIGEYLGRAFLQAKQRPLYLLSDTSNLDPS